MQSSSYLAPRPCIFQVSIGDVLACQEYHLPSSCARLQPCLLGGTSVPLVVWCPVLSCVLAIVRTLAACPASPSCSSELFATRSGLSLGRFLEISGLRPNTSCVGETPETDNRLFLASCHASGHSLNSYSVCGCTSARTSSSMSSNSWAWCSTLPCCSFASPTLRCLAVRTKSRINH